LSIIGVATILAGCNPNLHVCPMYTQTTGNLTAVSATSCDCNNGNCQTCQVYSFNYDGGSCAATVAAHQSFFGGVVTIGGQYTIWINKISHSCTFTSTGAMEATSIVGIVFLSLAGFTLAVVLIVLCMTGLRHCVKSITNSIKSHDRSPC